MMTATIDKVNPLVGYILDETIKKGATPSYENFTLFKEKAALVLKKYAEGIGVDKFVLGLSGGLDSAYVALVAKRSLELMGKDSHNLILVTLPCFGTGKRTFSNAMSLIEDLAATHINIDIKELANISLALLDISKDDRSTAFENIQARLRTALLLTLANKHNALELGTGDFSEIVLGWCTFGGDNVSMYNVNATVPKTFIRESILSFGQNENKGYLVDIATSPISPELLPSNSGEELSQHTEDAVGSYDLVDALIYYNMVKGYSIEKSIDFAKKVLPQFDKCDILKIGANYIEHYARVFEKRKRTQGFKNLSTPYALLTPLKSKE